MLGTRPLRLSTLALAGSLGASCSLFVSADDLSGAENSVGKGGVVAEAGTDADSGTSDAATPPVDSEADAPPASVCATSHAFCDDFDREPAGAFWSDHTVGTGAEISADGAQSVSPPHSLRVMYPASTEAIPAYWAKTIDLPAATRGFRASFDLFLESVGKPEVNLFGFQIRASQAGDTWSLSDVVGTSVALTGYSQTSDGGSHLDQHFAPGFPVGAWHHVEIAVVFEDSGIGKIAYRVDGQVAHDGAIDGPPPPYDQLIFGIGSEGAAHDTATLFHVDNFAVDAL